MSADAGTSRRQHARPADADAGDGDEAKSTPLLNQTRRALQAYFNRRLGRPTRRRAEPREGDGFDAKLSAMLDVLVARAEASGARR